MEYSGLQEKRVLVTGAGGFIGSHLKDSSGCVSIKLPSFLQSNGYWLDIGIEEGFKRAQREFAENRERILGD